MFKNIVFLYVLLIINKKMLKKFNKTLFQILLWLNASLSVAQTFQSGCPNANFSMGNLTGWVGYTGNYSNPGQTMGV